MAVNAGGPFYMTRAVVPHFLAQGWGRIIGVTTSLNTMYNPGGTPYGPSKAAHEALIAMAARELEGTGVTVNVLVPGGMSNTNLIPDEAVHSRESMIQPEVMRAPVVWLASEASDGINGQRFIGYYWDESLPLEERIQRGGRARGVAAARGAGGAAGGVGARHTIFLNLGFLRIFPLFVVEEEEFCICERPGFSLPQSLTAPIPDANIPSNLRTDRVNCGHKLENIAHLDSDSLTLLSFYMRNS